MMIGLKTIAKNLKFDTTMLKSILCNYSDPYILVKGTIKVVGAGDTAATRGTDRNNKKVFLKNCAPFTRYVSEINNTNVDNAKDLDIVMPMCNLLECSNNHAKTSAILWQYYRDGPDDNITNSESFKFKSRLIKNTGNNGTVKVEVPVPLK